MASCTTTTEEALAQGRLTLFAQPVCDVNDRGVVFEELLLRLKTPNGSAVGPGEILAAAERGGTVDRIDHWVLRQAAGIAAGGRPVSLNLSACSVSDPTFLARVERILAEQEAHPQLLTLEITETALASDLIQASRFAERLTALGCAFALDDFGTGYGALTYLKHLPFTYLKIDMSFVRDLVDNSRSQCLVSGIVALAKGFGLRTIAEGIEDQATLDLIRQLGVDLGQGFLLGRPRPLSPSEAPDARAAPV